MSLTDRPRAARAALAAWLAALGSAAHAAPLVWIDAAAPDAAALDAARALGAEGPPLDADALRYGGTDLGDQDRRGVEALEQTLTEVRAFETRLDGELVIVRDLARPIAALQILPDAAARDRLFRALAYQGFAVERYWGADLATDPAAVDLRVTLPDGRTIPRAWWDAMALEPERGITAYEVAEAPQRAAYEAARGSAALSLPALIHVQGLPAGASLVVDGRVTTPDAAGQLRVPPGRHYVHVTRGDHVALRAQLDLAPGAAAEIGPLLDDAAWGAWLADVRDDGRAAPPPSVPAAGEAWGGGALLGWTTRGRPSFARLGPEGVDPVPLEGRARAVAGAARGVAAQLAVGLGAGWFSSGDFYLQDPAAPRTRATVNAATADVLVELALQRGLFRVSGALDLAVTPGPWHVARTGDASTRWRPDVTLAIGARYAQVTAGFQFPYHPTVGVRATIPIWRGLEWVGAAKVGLPVTIERSDGTAWTGLPMPQAWVGLAWRQSLTRPGG